MKKNYLLEDIELRSDRDIEKLRTFFESSIEENKSMYVDEVIVNLFVDNELILHDCINLISKYRFGILRRLPLVNIYFKVNNVYMIKDLNNEIQNYITPIFQMDSLEEVIIDHLKMILCLFKQKGWKLQILLTVNDTKEFKQCIQIYNLLKCEFFEEELDILFRFSNNEKLLECAYLNMGYVMDTLKFLGMRNNIIIDCLLKGIREKETGVCQEFENSYKDIMKKLMKFDIEKYYGKKTLIREAMDDFAMV